MAATEVATRIKDGIGVTVDVEVVDPETVDARSASSVG